MRTQREKMTLIRSLIMENNEYSKIRIGMSEKERDLIRQENECYNKLLTVLDERSRNTTLQM